ncbi:hypothetical protein EGW08_017868 [Elysia chlorotica]|uniref:Ig-like domain-containing protein n=1 Tax=Elysia chlorotica TaxID=188477 RepID=A0A3S0ZGL0_ELYCH|nr:hypothetical protein EGW08_017868 [Elysia chlorotica]
MAEVRCFDCSGMSSPYDCTKIQRCRTDEQCYLRAYVNDAYSIMYDMGCQSNSFCSVVPKRSLSQEKEILDFTYAQLALAKDAANMSMVDVFAGSPHKDLHITAEDDAGNADELPHSIQKRQYEIPLCTKCCDQDHCNSDLCPSSLITKPSGLRCYDCGFATVTDPVLCLNVRYCGSDEKCHVASQTSPFGIKYQVNCDSVSRCTDSSTPFGKRDVFDFENVSISEIADSQNDGSGGISERDIADPGADELQRVSRAGATRCFTCCDNDFCNIDYCSRYRPLPGITNISTVTTTSTTTAATTLTTPDPRLSLLFVQFPEDVERELNTAPVRWVCQADGLPAPVYRWTRSPGATDVTSQAAVSADGKTSTLTFDPVTPADEGTYTCEASNMYESVNRTGTLTVWAPLGYTDPKLISVTEVQEGSDVTLNCEHTGYPVPQYSWEISLENGVNSNSTLTKYVLSNVSRDDSGTYECYVDNGRENRTVTTRLNVTYAPEFTSMLPVSINVTEGSNFTFQCPAEGNPPPEWAFMYVDESNFPHILSNVFTTANSDALIITKMLDSYSGSYTCYIKNNLGTKSQTVTVKVVP